jgi:hypothetical protein
VASLPLSSLVGDMAMSPTGDINSLLLFALLILIFPLWALMGPD